jgi:hypothetical protein
MRVEHDVDRAEAQPQVGDEVDAPPRQHLRQGEVGPGSVRLEAPVERSSVVGQRGERTAADHGDPQVSLRSHRFLERRRHRGENVGTRQVGDIDQLCIDE